MKRRRCSSVSWPARVVLAMAAVLCSVAVAADAQSPAAPAAEVLPLTRDDVAYLALMGSRDVKVERLNSRIVERDIENERAAFHPVFSSEGSQTSSKTLSGSSLSGSTEPETKTSAWSSGVRARLLSGATASLDFTNIRTESNSTFLTLNPQYQSTLALTLTQPLLRGFGPAVNTWRIKVAENNVRMSRYQLEARVASVLGEAETTYWDLTMAVKDVDVRGRALALTRELTARTEELVKEGILPETALLQARTSLLQRETDLRVSENQRRDAARRLQALLNFRAGADVLLEPLDPPYAEPRKVDIPQAVKDALAKRPELPQARLDVRNREVALAFARNQTLPQLNLFGSYGISGIGGEPAATTNPTVTIPIAPRRSVVVTVDVFPTANNRAVGDYQTALENMISGDFPTWKVGANLTIPIGNVAAQSQLQKAELEKQRAEVFVQNVEQGIALEVERLGYQVESSYNLIAVVRGFRLQSQQRLEVVRERFNLGTASLSDVVEAQRDLVTAEREEWKAIIDYNKVLVAFERATGALPQRYRVDF